jgi:ribosomal protein L29
MTDPTLYDCDFYAWANEQAALLRAGKLAAADIAHIAEEIESMGKSEQRELESRLAILLHHLLKWQFQPKRRSASWEASIRVQRRDLARHIDRNSSLKPLVPEATNYAYGNAVIEASAETGLVESAFPAECLWTFEQIMDAAFWPGDGAH